MLTATAVSKPVQQRFDIEVTVEGVSEATLDLDIRAVAYAAARETPSRTFGSNITRHLDTHTATVKIHRD